MFYANITSLSPHAKNYIVNMDPSINVLALGEIHKDDSLSVNSFFNKCGWKMAYNKPEPTTALNHGGEGVATRSHIHAREVDNDILNAISDHFNTNIRFAAKILSVRRYDILVISVYLWDSEGFSSRNSCIMQQIHMLASLIGLPFVCMGDFNIHAQEMQDCLLYTSPSPRDS